MSEATCPMCGGTCDADELVPFADPYYEEICGDSTPICECDVCRRESMLDI